MSNLITNKHRLPKAIVDAIKQSNSEYDNQGSNISASGITKPVRIYWLEKRHSKKIKQDAVDLIWSLIGSAVHFLAEKAAKYDLNVVAEKRFFKTIRGWVFSGQIDNFEKDTKTLTDFKITSVYSVKEEAKTEWTAQLNCQRLLMSEDGLDAEKLQICAVLRDWSKAKAKVQSDYPTTQVKLVPIEVWPLDKTREFLEERVALYQAHEHTPDAELPECSKEDKWATEEVWAVYKDAKAKRATKLFTDEISAKAFSANIGGRIEFRPGEEKRCTGYCNVNKFCQYWIEKYGDKNE